MEIKKRYTRTISFQSTEIMHENIEKMAEKKGLTKSGLIKLAITTYMDQQKAMEIFEESKGSILEKLDKITRELKKNEE